MNKEEKKLKYNKEIKKHKKIHFLPLRVYIAYLFICTLLLTGVSFSKYISAANGSDYARVAAGDVDVAYTDTTEILIKRPSSDGVESKSFAFQVTNKGSEVAIKYDIEVKLDTPLPEGATMMLDGKECYSSDGYTYKLLDAGTFNANENGTNEHTLTLAVDFDTYTTPGEFNYNIDISVISEQID